MALTDEQDIAENDLTAASTPKALSPMGLQQLLSSAHKFAPVAAPAKKEVEPEMPSDIQQLLEDARRMSKGITPTSPQEPTRPIVPEITAPEAAPSGFGKVWQPVRKALGYAPEQALSIVAHAVDFLPSTIRGTKETSRMVWSAIIGEENTAELEQLSYRIPVVGQLLKKGDELLDASGKFKNEADALLIQEALKQGGLPGVAIATITNTIIDALMTLKTLKVLRIGYGTQPGIKSTIGSAAIRATVMAVSAEGLSPKERLASLALGFAYQATPALSGTIGKWAKSDWIAKVADVSANAAITATFGKVVDEGVARAEAEGKPEMAGFYVMLNAIQKYGSDVVFGMMTKAFRASGNTTVVREIEKVAKAANVEVSSLAEAKPAEPSASVAPVGVQKPEVIPEPPPKPVEVPALAKVAGEPTAEPTTTLEPIAPSPPAKSNIPVQGESLIPTKGAGEGALTYPSGKPEAESLSAAKADFDEFEGATGTKNAYTREMQFRLGKPTDEYSSKTDTSLIEESRRVLEINPYAGAEVIRKLKTKGGIPTDVERMILLRETVVAERLLNEAVSRSNDPSLTGDEKTLNKIEISRAEDALQEIFNIEQAASREWGRTGRAMQKMMTENFSLARMTVVKKAKNAGKPLTSDQRADIKRIHDDYHAKLKTLNEKVAVLEAERDAKVDVAEKAEADKVMKDLEKQAIAKDAAERKGGKAPDLEGDKVRAIERIQDAAESGDKPLLSDLQDPIQKLALYFEQKNVNANKGVSTLTHDGLVKSVHGVIKKIIPTATPREVSDAISGYGTVRYPSKEAAKIALSQHKSELQKVAALEAVQKNIALLVEKGADAEPSIEGAKHTGFQRPAPGPITRDLTKQLQSAMKKQDRLMKELGIEASDPAARLKSALDAKKTRLKNQIEDINRAIENRKELVRNKGLPVEDAETIALETTRDARMDAYKELFPDKPMSDQERLDRAIQTTERSLEDWNERVEDARKGIFRTAQKSEWLPDSERLQNLIGEREAVKKEVNWWHNLAFPKLTPEESALAAFKKRTYTAIKKIRTKIATRDFTKPVRKEIILDEEAFKAKQELDKVKQEWKGILKEERMKNRLWTQKVWDRTTDPFNEARRILSSFDQSFIGRQGWFLLAGHPIRAVRTLKTQLKAWRSPHEAYKAEQEISTRENAKNAYYSRGDLEFTSTEGGMVKGEEPFATKTTELSKVVGSIPGIKASERSFTSGANFTRADGFDALVKTMARTGSPTDVELKAIGNFINIASGRAQLGSGRLAMATEFLSTVFWSPKLFISRFQLLAGVPFYHGSWRTRKLIAGEYARFLIGQGIVIAFAIAAGATVEKDPRSSDFGKLKIGDTRIDPMAGLAQATTFLARVGTGKTKTQRGRIEKLRGDKRAFGAGVTDIMTRFLRSKLSPLLGTMVDVAAGETVVGEKVTPGSVATRLAVPLSMNDILDSMVEQGVPRGTAISLLSILGWGVQTYDARRRNQKTAIDKLIWGIKFHNRQKKLKSNPDKKENIKPVVPIR